MERERGRGRGRGSFVDVLFEQSMSVPVEALKVAAGGLRWGFRVGCLGDKLNWFVCTLNCLEKSISSKFFRQELLATPMPLMRTFLKLRQQS